ncbi:unnamed protein product [Allacma fusca]|uniref:Ig-like domain-containing protein n=1 Tax=Allacma fusca TaxID=39272 RepID=A0A8J2KA63_9HEXA|nr:unnamed protein product [Allacma fusca]
MHLFSLTQVLLDVTKKTYISIVEDVRKSSNSPNDSTSGSSLGPPIFVQQEWKKKLPLNVKGFATVYQGVFLKLRCPGSGKAQIDRARIVWMKDHHYVHIQANKIEVVQKSGVLKIKNTTFSDSGIYTCLLNDRPLSNLTLHVQPYLQPIEMNTGGNGGRRNPNRQSSSLEQFRGRSRGPDGRPHPQHDGETTLFADQQPGVSVPMSDGLEPTIITQNPKTYTGASSSCGRIRPQLFDLVFIDLVNFIWMTWPLRKLANSVGSTLEDFADDNKVREGALVRSDLLYEPGSVHWNYEDEEELNCLRSQIGDDWGMSSNRGRKRACANPNAKHVNKTHWKVGSWSNCVESRCFTWNTSMQHRDVMCTFENGTITLGSHCNHTFRPEDEQECYNNLCQGVWRTEPWSPCKSRCDGLGIKVRILKCVWHGSLQPGGNACRSLPRPIVKKACRGPACLKSNYQANSKHSRWTIRHLRTNRGDYVNRMLYTSSAINY